MPIGKGAPVPEEKPTIYDLWNDEGPVLLIRGEDPRRIHELAAEHTHAGGLVLADSPEDIRIDNIRAVPCRPEGHDGDLGWCDGSMTVHYLPGVGGRGSFRGAFVKVRRPTREEYAERRRIEREQKEGDQ
jgi:hypothetical protein